jgi:hypothetical protein
MKTYAVIGPQSIELCRGGSQYVLRETEVCSVGRAFRSSAFTIIYHDVLVETLSSELFVLTLLTRLFCFFFC